MTSELPIPAFFDSSKVASVWRVDYAARFADAKQWKQSHTVPDASKDGRRVALLLIDMQNTFCIPGHELYVGGRTGMAAVEDTSRLATFIYRNLASISRIVMTMDTHTVMQIFHPFFWLSRDGRHPEPYTLITADEVEQGVWLVNPAVAGPLGTAYASLQRHALHYTRRLERDGKYALAVWPYHAMLGGIGHAIVPAVEEAAFFHQVVRSSPCDFQMKGSGALSENYSALRPEVLDGVDGEPIGQKNSVLIDTLLSYDAVIVAGQAKSHCVAWTVQDLLTEIRARDAALARKVYLLDDCTSPVVVPGVIDYTDAGNDAFRRFASAGMRIVRSTDPIDRWLHV